MTYADGTVPTQTTLYTGDRNVSISGTSVLVDGAPYLALGFYSAPPSSYQQIAKMGGNTLVSLGGDPALDCFATAGKNHRDLAYENGLNLLPDTNYTARLNTPSIYPGIATRYGHHLANIGWYIADEPDQDVNLWTLIAPTIFISESQALATKTQLPRMAMMQKIGYEKTAVPPYSPATDIWMAEPYGPDLAGVSTAVTNFNNIKKKPIWIANDSLDDGTISALVPKAYFAIVNGVTGILYFTWGDFAGDPVKLAAVTQVFTELSSLKNVIFGDPVAVTVPAGVTAIARVYQGKTYVIAVNPTLTQVTGSISVAGKPSGSVKVQFENRSLNATNGTFTDSFSGVSRHVYLLP